MDASRQPAALPPHRDPAAWDDLIESLNPPAILVVISSWMGERLQHDETVEDIWQETLAMAWRDREQFEWPDPHKTGVRSYRAWVLKIARNRVHDAADRLAARKRGGDRIVRAFSDLTDSAGDSITSLLPLRSTTPSRIARHRDEAQLMERAVDALPAELREVLRLRLFEELPMKEVAERAGIGLTTAKERFMRAAAMYRARLEELLGSAVRRR